jgi:hypothetical protein
MKRSSFAASHAPWVRARRTSKGTTRSQRSASSRHSPIEPIRKANTAPSEITGRAFSSAPLSGVTEA